MKLFLFLLPVLLGGLTVLQSGLNRHIGSRFGWPVVGLINNAAGWLFALSVTLVLLLFFGGRGISRPEGFEWWWIVPGVLGMAFVMGIPYSMHVLGASRTFVLLVGSQMVFGLAWDHWVRGLELPWTRLAGVGLAFVGALIASI